MTDRVHAAGSAHHRQERHSRRRSPLKGRSRVIALIVTLLLIIGSTIMGYFLGHKIAMRPLETANKRIDQLQPENQRLKTAILEQNSQILTLQGKLKNLQAELEGIRPKKDTYSLFPNQSINVADGRMNIGLVGPPTNASASINVNGKQQKVVTGDVIKVAPDAATSCEVRIQSFDMFQVIVHAVCGKAQ